MNSVFQSPANLPPRGFLSRFSLTPYKASSFLLIGHLLALTFILWLTVPNLTRSSDMYELYAWGAFPQWGSFKHPPLLAWIVGLWFQIFPRTTWAFHLLAALNATLGIFFVGCVVREMLPNSKNREHSVFLAMAFCALSLNYGNMAVKLNMNAILLTIWPLVTWLFVCSINKPRFGISVLLGLAGTLSILGKYFSGILLLSLFLISLSFPKGRHWYKTPSPYIALITCLLALTPHLLWLIQYDFATIRYAENQAKREFKLARLFTSPIILFALCFLALSALYFSGRTWTVRKPKLIWTTPAILLVFLPLILMLLGGVIVQTQLASPWLIPMAFGIPIALVLLLQSEQNKVIVRRRIILILPAFWLLEVILSAINTAVFSYKEVEHFYSPRQELSEHILAQGIKLNWAAGTWHYTTPLSFYSQDKIQAIPNLPNKDLASIHTPENWREQSGIMIYLASETEQIQQAKMWLQTNQLRFKETNVTVSREGWQFIHDMPFTFTLLWTCPVNVTTCQIPTAQQNNHTLSIPARSTVTNLSANQND